MIPLYQHQEQLDKNHEHERNRTAVKAMQAQEANLPVNKEQGFFQQEVAQNPMVKSKKYAIANFCIMTIVIIY